MQGGGLHDHRVVSHLQNITKLIANPELGSAPSHWPRSHSRDMWAHGIALEFRRRFLGFLLGWLWNQLAARVNECNSLALSIWQYLLCDHVCDPVAETTSCSSRWGLRRTYIFSSLSSPSPSSLPGQERSEPLPQVRGPVGAVNERTIRRTSSSDRERQSAHTEDHGTVEGRKRAPPDQ